MMGRTLTATSGEDHEDEAENGIDGGKDGSTSGGLDQAKELVKETHGNVRFGKKKKVKGKR